MRDVLLFEKHILKSLHPTYITLCKNSGFFPKNLQSQSEIYTELKKFTNIMQEATSNCDVFGTWSGGLSFEDYFIKSFGHSQAIITELDFFRPQTESSTPFSYAFKDATVLVIHPFEETIKAQYQNRDKLFANKKVLPHFNLKTFKAVQTLNEETDLRFKTWFEALDYMTQEIDKIDFDIALIGCGAYGFPLASNIKKWGKLLCIVVGLHSSFSGLRGDDGKRNKRSLAPNFLMSFGYDLTKRKLSKILQKLRKVVIGKNINQNVKIFF